MKYQRKSIIVEVMEFTGTDTNIQELHNMLGVQNLSVDYSTPLCPVLVINNSKKLIAPKGYFVAKTRNEDIIMIDPDTFKRDYERIDG